MRIEPLVAGTPDRPPSNGPSVQAPHARPGSAMTLEGIRELVAGLLDEPAAAIGDDDDLVRRGIDSVRIMMAANGWRRHGVHLKFADLIDRPTVGAWWALVNAALTESHIGTALGTPSRTAAMTSASAAPTSALTGHPEGDPMAPFELAPMQQAYWVGRGDAQVMGGVGAHYYVEFDGVAVDPARLENAARALLRRHDMLRAQFTADGRQQVLPASPWPGVSVHDLRGHSTDETAGALQGLRTDLSGRQLAVDRAEVFDLQLSLLPGGATRTHLNIDMLVSDAQSFQIILDELARLYLEPDAVLPPLRVSFAGYLAYQQQHRGETHERARAYWQDRLDELPGAPQLPLAVEPEQLRGHGASRRYHWLSADERRALAERARAHGLTLPVVFATAYVEVLAGWSADPRFLLNLPVFDREMIDPDVASIVGDFTNVVLLSVDLSGDLPFAEQASRLQQRLRDALAHSDYSGLEVLRDLGRSRPGDWMMAPVVFTSAIGLGELFSPLLRRCFGEPGWTSSQTPQVWLDQQVIEHDGGLLVNWDVVEELFPAGVVDAMFGAYIDLLWWLGTQREWDTPVPALLPAAQADIRARANATDGPLAEQALHAAFFERAAERPERTALRWPDGGSMSYRALADKALRIAAMLRERGLADGAPVAVTLPRGPDQIAGVLGVLAAGAGYVPVGIAQPALRRANIYANAGVRGVLTTVADPPAGLPDGVEALSVELAVDLEPLSEPVLAAPDALAYVIYTSGSTGTPKGVEITHRAAVNTVDDINARFGVGPDDRVLAVSALDFDLSVYDIFGLLSVGAAVVLIAEDDHREARRWVHLVRDCGVTMWNSVPALLDMLLMAADGQPPLDLRLILVSGDWIGLDLPSRTQKQCPDCRFVALGGATEAAIWSNAHVIEQVDEAWRSIPYGFPLRNQRYRVVDARGRDCPDWVAGELWIGGSGVARGYRGDPARTASQFADHDGMRWYRTGDVGRYWPDGSLEFLGRADLQVKIRGHRIELGEIETALEAHPLVLRAAATTTGDISRQLVAAVVTREGGLAPTELRPFVVNRLPAYMVPADVVVVDALPLNANGKVDRKVVGRLIEDAVADTGDQPPSGPIESAVAEIWTALLDVPAVGRGRSFFALGGDSLVATRLVEAVRARFGTEISLRQFFAAATVAELAVLVADQVPAPDEVEEGVI